MFSYPVSSDVGNVSNNSPELIIPLDLKKSDYSIANFFQKKQEIMDDTDKTKKMEQNEEDSQKDEDVSIVPAKRSPDTSDDETTNTKSKVQKTELDTSSPDPTIKSLSSTPLRTPKKSLRSPPSSKKSKRQPPRKKKVDVKESERITNYFTKSP